MLLRSTGASQATAKLRRELYRLAVKQWGMGSHLTEAKPEEGSSQGNWKQSADRKLEAICGHGKCWCKEDDFSSLQRFLDI